MRHPESPDHRPLLATRVEHSAWEAQATVASGSARLVLRSDDAHWVAVESTGGAVSARAVVGPFDQVLGTADAPAGVDRHARDPLERACRRACSG